MPRIHYVTAVVDMTAASAIDATQKLWTCTACC